MTIKPIRTKRDYNEALATVDRLWKAKKGSRNADKLDVLVTLIEAYEQREEVFGPVDPIEAILFRVEQAALSRSDLQVIMGVNKSHLSEILNRKRALTVQMIRRLVDKLGIPAEVLLGELTIKKAV